MIRFEPHPSELREPRDREARVAALDRLLAAHLKDRAPMQIVDLGDGGGGNLRYLAPRLGGRQVWRLYDGDAARCADGPSRIATAMSRAGYGFAEDATGLHLHGEGLDLTATIHAVDPHTEPAIPDSPPVDLVTGVACLDGASRDWLRHLASACAGHGAHVLLALSYDGRLTFTPGEAGDGLVRELANDGLRGTHRGIPYPGPDAAVALSSLLRGHGYEVEEARSDWHLGAEHTELYQRVHAGLAALATRMAPARADEIDAWLGRRMDLLAAGLGEITVGHLDILGLPPAPAASTRR